MTVQELINELEQYPKDMLVFNGKWNPVYSVTKDVETVDHRLVESIGSYDKEMEVVRIV